MVAGRFSNNHVMLEMLPDTVVQKLSDLQVLVFVHKLQASESDNNTVFVLSDACNLCTVNISNEH